MNNTKIIAKAQDRYRLTIKEALLISHHASSINKQFENFTHSLKLFRNSTRTEPTIPRPLNFSAMPNKLPSVNASSLTSPEPPSTFTFSQSVTDQTPSQITPTFNLSSITPPTPITPIQNYDNLNNLNLPPYVSPQINLSIQNLIQNASQESSRTSPLYFLRPRRTRHKV